MLSPDEASPLPQNGEPIMPLHVSQSNSAFGRAGIRTLMCNNSKLKQFITLAHDATAALTSRESLLKAFSYLH